MYSKKATAFNLQSKYWLTSFFSSNFWKRCGKKIKLWAKLRTWSRRRGKKKYLHYCSLASHSSKELIYPDSYLNNSTWLGRFVRETDSRRTGNILFNLQRSALSSWRLLLWSLLKASKGSTKRFTGIQWNSSFTWVLVLSSCSHKYHRLVP